MTEKEEELCSRSCTVLLSMSEALDESMQREADGEGERRKLIEENASLQGYKRLVEGFKAEGFDSVMSFKEWNRAKKARIEELEKENAELKAQIKKMKCCSNCQKSKLHEVCNYWYQEFDCKKDDYREWEMAV